MNIFISPSCVYPCVNCTDTTTCDSCVAGANRGNAPNCTCDDGFYHNPPTIKTCEGIDILKK